MLKLEDACQTPNARLPALKATGMHHGFKESQPNASDWLALLRSSIYVMQCSTLQLTLGSNQSTRHSLRLLHLADNLEERCSPPVTQL
jgi:hypothetical protein